MNYDYAKYAGETLRRLIKENGYTQEEFAFKFGCDVRTLNRYINEGINSISVLQELVNIFQVKSGTFFPD